MTLTPRKVYVLRKGDLYWSDRYDWSFLRDAKYWRTRGGIERFVQVNKSFADGSVHIELVSENDTMPDRPKFKQRRVS